jgi:hypothetical protein
MQFIPFEEGIEVKGTSVRAVVEGFSHFAALGSAYLLDKGLGTPTSKGLVGLEPDGWYSHKALLLSMKQIHAELGAGLLTRIGMAIPRIVSPVGGIQDIHDAIKYVDVAYHLHHRKNGQVMFDPATGRMEEGIGHYGYEPVPGQRKIFCLCETPYPCAFDQGLLTAMAQRYQPHARVTHEDRSCRGKQAERCTYVITW